MGRVHRPVHQHRARHRRNTAPQVVGRWRTAGARDADRQRLPAPPPAAMSAPLKRAGGLAERLPAWLGSIRFRLTLSYSLLLFGLAAMVVGGMYAALAQRLDDEPVSQTYVIQEPVVTPQGIALQEQRVQAE